MFNKYVLYGIGITQVALSYFFKNDIIFSAGFLLIMFAICIEKPTKEQPKIYPMISAPMAADIQYICNAKGWHRTPEAFVYLVAEQTIEQLKEQIEDAENEL